MVLTSFRESPFDRASSPAAFVLDDRAALHHERHGLQEPDVGGRVPGNRDQVGEQRRRHRPRPGPATRPARRHHGRALDRLHRRHPEPHVAGQVLRLGPERGDPAVGAVGDLGAGRHRLAEHRAADLVGPAHLAHDLLGVAERRALLDHVVAVGDVDHEVRAVLDHERHRLVVDQRGVLDRAHAGAHRAIDPHRSVRVARRRTRRRRSHSSTAARISSSVNSGAPGSCRS